MRLAVLAIGFGIAVSVRAGVNESFDAFNHKIHDELRAANPEAESLLTDADAARARNDYRAASDLYAKVFAKAPTFVHALRREADAELRLGNRSSAFELASHAVQLVRSSDNLAMFALVVATPANGSEPNADDMKRAMGLVREAVVVDHKNLFAHVAHAEVALAAGSLNELDEAIAYLKDLVPDDGLTMYFRSISALGHGDFAAAASLLEAARAAGVPEEQYRSLSAAIAKASYDVEHPLWKRVAWWAGIAFGGWIATGLVLFASGLTLSAITLKQSERVPADPSAGPTSSESRLRGLYRFILGVCCVYYYLSMPILVAAVLLVGGGLLYEMLTIGHMPIKLIVIVFVLTVVTLWSILKSVIVRARDADPGERLDLEKEPALREVLLHVAERVGTRPVDTVFLTPGTDMAVFERGGLLRQLAGKSERCLILGAGVLEGMRLSAFQAVLAHEYGHFSNRDTAGGGFALSVRRSVVALAVNLANAGAANWYNPAWLFVNGFHRVFLRISQGASRLQEVLADRWSAILYGAAAFEEGLRHVIGRSVRFDNHVSATIQELVESKRVLTNLYRYEPLAAADGAALDGAVQAAIERQPSAYDSHPCPLDRFRWVHALPVSAQVAKSNDAGVWTLFQDRDAVEQRMTAMVRAAVAHNHGIQI